MSNIEESIKAYARSLGFDAVGITTAEPFLRDEQAILQRLHDGMLDGMPWYTAERARRANNPAGLLAGARSIISVAASYYSPENPQLSARLSGRIARYARNEDYHDVMKQKLKDLARYLTSITGRPVNARVFVDDGPLNDRAVAERAGVGWFGKNTNIIIPLHGSWVLLGEVLTDLDLKPDTPLKKSCGSCTRCIDACPAGAIVAPYVVDSRRCISYLTTESRGTIPHDLRPLIGNRIFGCDVCQEACPINAKVATGPGVIFKHQQEGVSARLIDLLALDDEAFRHTYRRSAFRRAKRVGIQRNACIALGNAGDGQSLPSLVTFLAAPEPVLRLHAAWAIGKIGTPASVQALKAALLKEQDPAVIDEITMALKENPAQ